MKAVLLYLVLVGLPVLGVLGILRIGGGLSAPPNLRGGWRGGLSPAAQLVPPCVELSSDAAVFDITQSGVHVSVTLNDAARTHLDASLLGPRLWGRAERLPLVGTARSACPDAPLELAAEVVREGDVPQLVGNLWAGGCAACAPVSFRAERVSGGR
jgi:hypothetical protein